MPASGSAGAASWREDDGVGSRGRAALTDERDRVRAVYDAYAASEGKRRAWSIGNAGNRAIREELAARVLALSQRLIEEELPILDIGCGTGWWLARLRDEGVAQDRLFGIDILPERVAASRQVLPRAEIHQGDATTLPWNDASFGLVTMFSFLSSLGDAAAQRTALVEARRVAAEGASVVTWEPRWPTPWNRKRIQVSSRAYGALDAVALHTQTITVLPAVARRLGPASTRLYPVLAQLPFLRSHRLVVATVGKAH